MGYFFAFISAVLYYSQASKYEDFISNSNIKQKKIQYLKLHYQEKVNAFYMFEVLFYSTSTTYLSIFFNNLDFNWIVTSLLILPIFTFGFILRFLIYSIGIRFSNILIVNLIGLLYYFAKINTPLIGILQMINHKVGGRNDDEDARDELKSMVETAHEEGSIEASEYRILKNIMKFNDVYVCDVMTPRTVVISFEADRLVEDVIHEVGLRVYSRIPIWEGDSLDKGLIGYVLSKDILHAALNGKQKTKLRDYIRQIHFVPENVELDVALEHFLKNKQHLMVVIDEHGGFDGLISMEDVLETILGVEIMDEADKIEDLRSLATMKRDKRIANYIKKNTVV